MNDAAPDPTMIATACLDAAHRSLDEEDPTLATYYAATAKAMLAKAGERLQTLATALNAIERELARRGKALR